MTYARARLYLGISGVGTAVMVSLGLLLWRIPERLFSTGEEWSAADVWGFVGFLGGFLLLMLPFDLLGGYLLPSRFGRSTSTLPAFLFRWGIGVSWQAALFVPTGLALLAAGRQAGLGGVLALLAAIMFGYVAVQAALARQLMAGTWSPAAERLDAAWGELAGWGYERLPTLIADHADEGFTGGIVGLPGRDTIVLPRLWADSLSVPQLSVVLARRVAAITSGQRLRGLLIAAVWTLVGFGVASLLPTAGVRSVAQLIATICGFTCWTFLGLLVLPTISRQASFAIDGQVVRDGLPHDWLVSAVSVLDRFQDDEPQRPGIVETIFHPVPSVGNRLVGAPRGTFGAWHVARTTLFLSWACLGLLSRAVHCNAGRPELWVLLPTD